MILEKQLNGSSSRSVTMQRDVCVPPVHDDPTSNGPDEDQDEKQDDSYYIAKVSPLNYIEGLLMHMRSVNVRRANDMLTPYSLPKNTYPPMVWSEVQCLT